MTLIASISGIRGTIGGSSETNFTPPDIVDFACAYGMWLTTKTDIRKVVVGRDARVSGLMVENLVTATFVGLGFEVINLGLSTTPTVEVAVPDFGAAGGIIITASHNPINWNALKLLNAKGEFISNKDGQRIMEILENRFFSFALTENLGKIISEDNYIDKHIDKILSIPQVDISAIQKADFNIVVDGINSSGGVFVPKLLEALGVKKFHVINGEPTGQFAHNPEPIAENLTEICEYIKGNGADVGIVVDPDVDRLALIDENGDLFGEEYTLVSVADYILEYKKGAVVSNLSSSRALKDVAEKYGCPYYASAVGEVNVIEKMKRHDAVIGGEGNGGIIFPDLHFGRDALMGIALFLSHLARKGKKCSQLRAIYPNYFMSKQKIQLKEGIDVDKILSSIKEKYTNEKVSDIDGVKVDFEESWVHLRKSNTEPIIRVYSEAKTQEEADQLAHTLKQKITEMV